MIADFGEVVESNPFRASTHFRKIILDRSHCGMISLLISLSRLSNHRDDGREASNA